MQFSEIVTAVLADGFSETKRGNAKDWVRFRHAWLWDFYDWSFKFATDTVTVTAGSNVVSSVPDDFGVAVALIDDTGCLLKPIQDFREFFAAYNTNLAGNSAAPEAFTVIGGSILVGPVPVTTDATWQLIYKRRKPDLTNDTDTTGLPEGYDIALVHGGKAEGFKLATVPLWEGFDEDFSAVIKVMEAAYLSEVDGDTSAFGDAYRPDQWC